MNELVITTKNLMKNGGVFYAKNRFSSSFGDQILKKDKIYLKNGSELLMYKKISMINNDNIVKVTFSSSTKNNSRIVFVVCK